MRLYWFSTFGAGGHMQESVPPPIPEKRLSKVDSAATLAGISAMGVV